MIERSILHITFIVFWKYTFTAEMKKREKLKEYFLSFPATDKIVSTIEDEKITFRSTALFVTR